MTKPDKSISSKTWFIASTIAIIMGLFLAGHVGLVTVYKSGAIATIITAIVCSTAVVALFIRQRSHRFFPLLAGTALWAVVGEIAEHLGFLTIVDARFVFALVILIGGFAYIINERVLPFFPAVSSCLFLGVWTSHFVMVNMFETFGKRHVLTYASSLLFAGFLVYSVVRMNKTSSRLGLTIGSITCTCSCWSLLEYLWAWKAIPKPW